MHKGAWFVALVVSFLAGSLFLTCAFAKVSTQYPFCLQGDDYPGWSNCTFTSLQQCQATASGLLDECMANPWCHSACNIDPLSRGIGVQN
jgi:hypothetical protein